MVIIGYPSQSFILIWQKEAKHFIQDGVPAGLLKPINLICFDLPFPALWSKI
jgi:hypothetical protein